MNVLRHQKGFTLIEMLVSLALFTIVSTMSVGTLLVLIGGNSRVVNEQITLSTLSFALDSMTREIRTGSEYFCHTVSGVSAAAVFGSATAVRDCTAGDVGISFREAGASLSGGGTRRIAYFFDNGSLWRKIGNQTAQEITVGDVRIINARFIVTGAAPLGTGSEILQPSVSILIVAGASSSDSTREFTLQTTVTQRPLDL